MESVDDPILRGPEAEPYYERAMELYRRRRGTAKATAEHEHE